MCTKGDRPMLGYGIGTGRPGMGVLHASGNVVNTPLLALVTGIRLFMSVSFHVAFACPKVVPRTSGQRLGRV